jgi:cell shape-determining protein MreC
LCFAQLSRLKEDSDKALSFQNFLLSMNQQIRQVKALEEEIQLLKEENKLLKDYNKLLKKVKK